MDHSRGPVKVGTNLARTKMSLRTCHDMEWFHTPYSKYSKRKEQMDPEAYRWDIEYGF